MVKNHSLAKSINDAAWYRFREWLEYFGNIYRVDVIAVDPRYTSQNCSSCSQKVLKSLSTRTHVCPYCGYQADRDENAAINILSKALEKSKTTLGHRESNASGENPLCSCSGAAAQEQGWKHCKVRELVERGNSHSDMGIPRYTRRVSGGRMSMPEI